MELASNLLNHKKDWSPPFSGSERLQRTYLPDLDWIDQQESSYPSARTLLSCTLRRDAVELARFAFDQLREIDELLVGRLADTCHCR